MDKETLYNELVNWSSKYDLELNDILVNNKDYSLAVLNIEREKKKPRKDYVTYSDIKKYSWYMFNDLFNKEKKEYEWQSVTDLDDDHDTWFDKLKLLAKEFSYAEEVKDYKENPSKYKGSITDIATIIRVAITTKSQTPDLYEILHILGRDTINERINLL